MHMDLSRNSRTRSNSTSSQASPPTSPMKKLFKPRRSMRNLRRRKSEQEAADEEDLDFCCGGEESHHPQAQAQQPQQQKAPTDAPDLDEIEEDQVSPLPLYNKTWPNTPAQQMQEPDYEFPPRYALTSSAGHEEKRLQLEQAKAVDALHEFFENRSLSRRTSHASITAPTSTASSARSSMQASISPSQQQQQHLSATNNNNPFPAPRRIYRSGSEGNLLTLASASPSRSRSPSMGVTLSSNGQIRA